MKYELRKKIRLGLILIICLLFAPLMAHGQSTSLSIPKAIKLILDRNYTGWEIGAVSSEVGKFFQENKFKSSPVLVSGDFDGDGNADYAIKINYQGKWNVIAFLAKGEDYEEYVLKTGNAPNLDVYLTLHKKGETDFNYETDKYFIFQNDAVEITFFEKAGLSYIFENNKFNEVCTSD